MWTKCADGIYRLDCVLEKGVIKQQASITPRGEKYRIYIEGLGSFREPKTLKEINEILARHGLWPFRETTERCSSCLACSARMNVTVETASATS
jgi:hypothetical protein